MKKVLKFAIVLITILALLSGNITVIAVNVPITPQTTVEENITTIDSTSKNKTATESVVDEKTLPNDKTITETTPQTESTEKTVVDDNLKEDEKKLEKSEDKDVTSDSSNENALKENKVKNEPKEDSDKTSNGSNKDSIESKDYSKELTTSEVKESEKNQEDEDTISNNNLQNSNSSSIVTTNSDEPVSSAEIEDDNSDGNNGEDETKIERPDMSNLPGKLRVVIDLRMPIGENVTPNSFQVSLNKVDDGSRSSTDGVEQEKKLFYTFDNLQAGTYSLTISGNGHQTISQKVEIESNVISELNFTNGYDDIDISAEGDPTKILGVVGIGDVDKDGNITENDETAILDKIEGKQDEFNYDYDLNNDNIVDIVDLSYAVINKKHTFVGAKSRDTINMDLQTITTSINQSTTKISSEGTTTDIKDLLTNNDKHITLAPSQGNEISEDHPVEIGVEIGDDTTETQILSISPSTNVENNITDGIVTIDGYDYENHKAVEYICQIGDAQIPSNKEEKSPSANIRILGKVATIGAVAINNTENIDFVLDNDIKKAEISKNGTIVIDFGNKIAVKKVIIKVTGTNSNKLADISRVEFLNSMEDKIPEPNLNIPTLRIDEMKQLVGEDNFTVKWNNEPNVTAYEVSIRAQIDTKGTEFVENHIVEGHQLVLNQFNGKSIKDLLDQNTEGSKGVFTKYHIKVRSLNGEWYSPYCEEVTLQPGPSSAPQAPTGVILKGGYQTIKVTWNKDPRATNYYVYYKKVGSKDEFKLASPSEGITETTFTIKDLASTVTKYEVYVKSSNSKGMSPESEHSVCDTIAVQEVTLPKYKMINKSNGEGVLSQNIKNITFGVQDNRNMKDSALDMSDGAIIKGSAKGVADNNFGSYLLVDDWDFGGFYSANNKGIIVEFNKEYKTNYITMAQVEWYGDVGYGTIYYQDSNDGNKMKQVRASQVVTRKDADGNKYTAIKLSKPITTSKMVVGFGNSNTGNRKLTVAEMGFYEYDDIEDRINALFADNMHLTLAEGVTKEKIDALESELNDKNKDASGEYHPERDAFLKEIETARDLLKNKSLGKIININSEITTFYDSHIEFKGSLNGWQPLGIVAHGGEEITIYVGNEYKNVGENTRLQLIFTQWRAEASSWYKKVIDLQVGKNVVTIPNDLISTDRERGGSLYINYTGLKDDDPFRFIERSYAVRVVGGEEIPVLDLSSKEDKTNGGLVPLTEDEKKQAIKTYITELDKKVKGLEAEHKEKCIIDKNDTRKPDYGNGEDCILGATEIVLDKIMYSVSSKQIYEALAEDKGNKATIDDKANALYNSLTAMDNMIDLFYSQKGLVKSNQDTRNYGNNNLYPRTRQNIRCMRMTGRAFMYAGGLHIGIQWNEVKDLSRGVPMQIDEKGKRTGTEASTGNYFGWGIAHEIGHVINQQAYVHGEVTNNYFSILAQTDSTRNTVRFNYDDIYQKVTSGKTGKAQNVFTQLGLYWQLHLAYDQTNYDYKKYETQAEQFENSIFARIDTYARNIDGNKICTIAPTPTNDKGVKLQINSDTDNNLMRLACAATKKNVLEFFEKWGMVPNSDTIAYAEQWKKETRAIWYVNDEARAYVIDGNKELTNTNMNVSITNATDNRVSSNKVEFSLGITGDKSGLLGYEIVRSYMSNDKVVSRPVAFVEGDKTTYTDTIDTLNNRVFTYQVIAYDKHLNKVGQTILAPVKVQHKGEISQSNWEITTNMKSESDKTSSYKEQSNKVDATDEEQIISGASILADGKVDTEFVGTTTDNNAEIIISLPETKKLVGLKYTAKEQIKNYEIFVSSDGNKWTSVRKNVEEVQKTSILSKISNFFVHSSNNEEVYNGSEIIYFSQAVDGKEIYNYDYDCSYVKFVIHSNTVSIQEIDLLGQSGDNVEFEEKGSIGKLEKDFVYDTETKAYIPSGSIIFTGTYKGNPAYNVVKLWFYDDESKKWELVEGYQIILAPDPGKADLGETSDGSWIYVVEQKEIDLNGKYTENNNPYYEKLVKALGAGKVRAELYRVDNAKTNEGERLVSDTLVTTLPKVLDNVELKNSQSKE